jgi:hypothetical protein
LLNTIDPLQAIPRALVFRLLGHVLLCGVLHVAYQTPERVKGQYMVCVLYKSCLVLATTSRFYTPYTVDACISLANGSIEESDNGRGMSLKTLQTECATDLNRRPVSHCLPHLEICVRA